MAESKTLAARGVLAVVAALALSAVLFFYTENLPIHTEMEARSAYLAGGPPASKGLATTVTAATTQPFPEGYSTITTVTIYNTLTEKLNAQSEQDRAAAIVTTVTRTVTVNVTVTVTKTS